MLRSCVVVVLVALLVVGTGCSSDVGAPGPGGTSGSSGGGDGGATSGKKKNGEVACASDDECESNHCFKGGTQSFCTIPCTTDNATTVCVAPLTGTCNKQGYCKRD